MIHICLRKRWKSFRWNYYYNRLAVFLKCPSHSVSARLRLEGTPGVCQVQPPAHSRSSQSKLLRAGSCQVLSTFKGTDYTTSQKMPCKCLTTLGVKMFSFCSSSIFCTAACAHCCHWVPLREVSLLLLHPVSHQACIPIDKSPQSLLFSSSLGLSLSTRYSRPLLHTGLTAVPPSPL